MSILDFFRGSKTARVAKRVMSDLRASGESRRMELNEASSVILIFDAAGKQAATYALANLIHDLDQRPNDEHEAIYERYVRGFRALEDEEETRYEHVRPTLRVLLKDASYPAYIELLNRAEHGATADNPLVWRPIAANVIACAVVETESSLSFVNERSLEKWGVAANQVLDDAVANTRALPLDFGYVKTTRFVNANDSFIAARLLCDAAIRAQPWKGMPVAVVPDRDTLFLAGSEDEEGLIGLAALNVGQLEANARLISAVPLVLTESGWQEFEPPESSRIAFGNVARRFDALYWSDYKPLLEKDLAAKGEDIFVASLDVYEKNDTGEYFSSVVWSRGADSILPAADRVNFYDGDDEPIRYAPWAEVMRVVGHLMKPLDGAPSRYRVQAFPSTGEFLQMGAKAL